MSDRLPPHSIEAEQGLLGSLLQGQSSYVWEFIATHPEAHRYFYDGRHADIFKAIGNLANTRKPIDPVSVVLEMEKVNPLSPEQKQYIGDLPDASPSGANFSYYASELQGLFHRREIIRVSGEASMKAFKGDADALEFAASEMLAIGESHTGEDDKSMQELCSETLAQLEDGFANRGKIQGVPTGFATLDKMLRGLKPGQLFVIGGRPGHGKTALAMNIVERAAVDCQISTGVFSLEMTKHELTRRLLCSRARVPSDELENGNLSADQYKAVTVSLGKISKAPITIQDQAGLTIGQLQARARRMKHRHKVEFLVVDYLQLIHGRNKQNRTQELTEISVGLKSLAKELALPVLALAQLNRENERDGNREPRLSDLRDSGSIEQDADMVALLHPGQGDTVDLLLKKHRNGPCGRIPLRFIREITRFEQISPIQ